MSSQDANKGRWWSPDYCPICGNQSFWTPCVFGTWYCSHCQPPAGEEPLSSSIFTAEETRSAWPAGWMPPKPVGPALEAVQRMTAGTIRPAPSTVSGDGTPVAGRRCTTPGCAKIVTVGRETICRHHGIRLTCTDCAFPATAPKARPVRRRVAKNPVIVI